MRKLKIIEHISLDGVIQHSADDGDFPYSDWTAPYRTPAGREAVMAAHGERFDLVLGRRTYDIWSGFWPKAPSNPIGDRLDIGVQPDWRLPDHVTVQGAVVKGDGPNRGANPDNRMAYYGRAVVTLLKGLDVGGAFEGYSDSTGIDGQAMYTGKRWAARAEYIQEHNRRTDIHARGWYALPAYSAVPPRRVQLVARIEQFDPNDRVATDRLTGCLVGAQYFMHGDDFKLLADYEVFREQVTQLNNNRGVVQLQVRW